jgi:hypothetical protein
MEIKLRRHLPTRLLSFFFTGMVRELLRGLRMLRGSHRDLARSLTAG